MRAAEELLTELGISDPVDIELEAIAHCVGVEVEYRRLANCEAQIIGFKDRAVVYVSPHTTPHRRNSAPGTNWGIGTIIEGSLSSAARQTSANRSTRNRKMPSARPTPIPAI